MLILRFLIGALLGLYSMRYIAKNRINIELKVFFVFIVAVLLGII